MCEAARARYCRGEGGLGLVEVITHYYKEGSVPFRSLSALTDAEALEIMNALADDSPLFARFKEPSQYLFQRKRIEKRLREQFVARGGRPVDLYPLYAVLGTSHWIEVNSSNIAVKKLELPISIFKETEISCTFPDSMVSYWLAEDQPPTYYQPELHGKVFTLSEIMSRIHQYGVPQSRLPDDVAPYIEVQIWNHHSVQTYLNSM